MYQEDWKNAAYRRLKVLRRRCNSVTASNYQYYGAKGIKCLLEPQEFFEWYKCTKPKGNFTIGRKDHSKHYTIENIEWQSQSVQTKERNSRHGIPKSDKRESVEVLVSGSRKIFSSFNDAANYLGVSQPEISMMVAGKYKKPKHYRVRRL